MKQLEFLFLAALISGIASYASSQRRKRKALLLTRKNLFRATGILLSALTMLLIGCALMALIHARSLEKTSVFLIGCEYTA